MIKTVLKPDWLYIKENQSGKTYNLNIMKEYKGKHDMLEKIREGHNLRKKYGNFHNPLRNAIFILSGLYFQGGNFPKVLHTYFFSI